MLVILLSCSLFFGILIVIYFLILIFGKRKAYDREKNSPFECGFDPFVSSRISFSIHFFSVMLMFLIFDVELTILTPLPVLSSETLVTLWSVASTVLISILLLGLVLEWSEGSMEWK